MPSLTAAAVVAGEAPGGYLQAAGSGTSAATGGAGAPDAVGDRDAASSHGAAVDAAGRGVPRPTTLTPIGTPIMSSSALDALQESVPLARQVELDALVLLRIVGACERASGVGAGNPLDNAGSRSWGSRPGEWGAADASCAGQLLGWLDSDESSTAKRPVLHVTSAFTFPRTATARTGAPLGAHLQPQQRAQRLREASRLLRDVNREHQPVGWFYQADSGQLSSFINADWTEMQYQYQRCLKNAVCVVYDPLRKWSSATLGIRVVRLSAPFMQEYRRLLEGAATAAGGGGRGAAAQGQAFGRGGGRVVAGSTFTSEALRDLALCSQTMIEDVPFTLRSSALVEQYLAAYGVRSTATIPSAGRLHHHLDDIDSERLRLGRERALAESTVETLVQDMDELTREQSRYQHFLRSHARTLAQQAEWLRKRRADNEQRIAAGHEPLPEDKMPPFLSNTQEPSRLETMMVVRDLVECLRDLETSVAGRCEKEFGARSLCQ
ncbi:hypothetical protein CDCA_CDCA06G1858 [Cyanidium caldarium]|uniref:eIF3h C-terminal domain-containing protein n=1 Tax=Cyanidium caldarium TaxID=2771 RepID=A0AAV9IVK4_CYACA|nr:hypothetical protein CDCA_CDCA06G1858 [Cyanidium caldarium]